MKTVKQNELKFKNEEIKNCLELLLSNGYRVFKSFFDPKSQLTYFTYSKDDKVAYLQADYSGVKVSTVHKPCREFGTGFGIWEYSKINVDLELLNDGFISVPPWAKGDASKVVKYNSLDEYFTYENKFTSNTVEIVK